jgi:hypothetical protein
MGLVSVACIGKFDGVELLRVLKQEAEPHKFAPDGAPLGAAVFAADAVGRKRVMSELANLLRLRAAKHFHDMLDPDAETAFLPDAVYARQKFLRSERPVPRRARREAIVAAGAIKK